MKLGLIEFSYLGNEMEMFEGGSTGFLGPAEMGIVQKPQVMYKGMEVVMSFLIALGA
jgi:hypothetical protein